jgi:imidazolonepropionase-like amidohydrolase
MRPGLRASALIGFALIGFMIGWPLARASHAQTPTPSAERLLVRAGRLIDGLAATSRADQGILIEGDRISAVGPYAEIANRAAGAKAIDLSGMTVLPGLIDAHTHILLQGDVTAADYDEQLLKESIPYRTIRATAVVRRALMNGFTTMRDLETEGAMYADVDVKTAIERGVIPGPRLFVSTRAFSATGMYPLLGYSWELKMPEGVQIVDGPNEIRKAVREQVKYGADWIKVYADRRYYIAPDGRLRSWVNFTDEEFKTFVEEAHRLGRKVAAHAMGWDGIDAALRAGVNSIEHGDGLTPDLIDRMVKQKVFLVPHDLRDRLCGQGAGRSLAEDGRPGAPGVRRGAQARPHALDLIRNGRGRLLLGREPGEGAGLHGALRDVTDAGDQIGDQRGGATLGSAGQPGRRGARAIRRSDRGKRRSPE